MIYGVVAALLWGSATCSPSGREPRWAKGRKLVDPERCWDEEDAKRYDIASDEHYSYARVPTGTDQGYCYLMDVWIVDDEGRPHPGYDDYPIPVRTEDLYLERGRPLAGETPKPKSIFDSDWLRR